MYLCFESEDKDKECAVYSEILFRFVVENSGCRAAVVSDGGSTVIIQMQYVVIYQVWFF